MDPLPAVKGLNSVLLSINCDILYSLLLKLIPIIFKSVYQENLNQINWDLALSDITDVDQMCNIFTDKLYNTCKLSIPNKVVAVRPWSKPFYNGYLRRLKRKLNRIHIQTKLTNTGEVWAKFRHERNHYTNEVKRCKYEFEQKKIDALNNTSVSSKTYFKLAKELFSEASDSSIPPLVTIGDTIIVDDHDKACAFNEFFSKASNIDDSIAILPENIEPIDGISLLTDISITEQEIMDQLSILDTNKSYGDDNISPMFLKKSGDKLLKPLKILFNLSMSSSTFPKLWKIANVLPLYKKGPKDIMNNYRPVSLLSILGKVFERIIFKHVFNHFRSNFLISIWQSGFLPGSSTVTQLLELHYQFCKAVSDNKEIRVVFLDISKAFDRVWHKGLLFKLKKWGISGPLLAWFQSYLTDRFQRVIINGQRSHLSKIKAGVPQGSVLGPLLFLVFINDLTDVINHCKIRLFADDTCLFITVDNNRDISARLINTDLKAIELWANKWLVSFSAPKTKSMIISYKTDLENHPPIYLHDIQIETVKKHKHVGLWFESNLWWHFHINDIFVKASKRLNVLKYYKFKLNRDTLERFYLVFIRPIIEYADVVWTGAHISDLCKLDKLQVEALRICTGCTNRSNINNLYLEFEWPRLGQRRDEHVLKMFYKIANNLVPDYLTRIFPKKVSELVRYPLRNSDNLVMPYCRVECFKHSFIPYGIILWNDLESETRELNTISAFSTAIRKRFVSSSTWSIKPKIYSSGNRFENIHQSRLRVGCSKLNFDLCFNLRVINSASCLCGAKFENAFHFFMECPLLYDLRVNLFNTVSEITPLKFDTLLYGNKELSLACNLKIFKNVQIFIKDSKRFDD